jgi:hypothetical protein
MSRPIRPTPELTRAIVAFIRAGSFPQVAAEAAGLPTERFADWMERGARSRAPLALRQFFQAIRKAQAEARLTVEVELRQSKPLDWLRCGPGKPGDLGEGWTTPLRGGASGEEKPVDLLALPLTQEVIARVLSVLTPHPELRQAVACALDDLSTPASVPGR